MAKKKTSGVNKSAAIRDYLSANSQAKPAAVAAALKAQGIEVDAQYVSIVKSNTKKQSKKRRSPSKRPSVPGPTRPSGVNDQVSIQSMLQMKKLVQEVGSFEEAHRSLTLLEQLAK
ncbi:MAG: hypothetical protein AAF802_08510 [Planctomycetota bacterium]